MPWTSYSVKARPIEPHSAVTISISTKPVVAQAPNQTSPGSPSAQTTTKAVPKSAMRQSSSKQLPSRAKVDWASSISTTSSSMTRSKQQSTKITNLCKSLMADECGNAVPHLGFVEDDTDAFELQPKQNPDLDLANSVSLKELLQGSKSIRLDRRQRYTIAFALVLSHLQLYPSAWLGSRWSKEEIFFAKSQDDNNKIRFDEPYLARQAYIPPSTTSLSTYASSDRLLPTLGIVLLELCFGKSLEEHEMRKLYTSDTGQAPVNADLAAALDLGVALEWSRSVGGEAGELYANAVQWCLKGQVSGTKDDKWREELFTNVVQPLQYCYEQLYPKPQA